MSIAQRRGMRNSRQHLHPAQASPTASAYPCVADSRFGRLLQRLAGAEVPVLFAGQRGSGKRWIARSLHAQSAPRGPLVEVDFHPLAVGPDDRSAEVELLERSMRQATGGFLLIADPCSLSALGQSAVVELAARPRSDVRIIACVHDQVRALPGTALRRQFIDSFLHVDLPPLYKRRLELPAIIDLFVSCRAEAAGCLAPRISPAVIDRLGRRGWPTTLAQIERFATHVVLNGDSHKAAQGLLERRDVAAEHAGRDRPLRSVVVPGEAPSNLLTFGQRKVFTQARGRVVPSAGPVTGRRPRRLEDESSETS